MGDICREHQTSRSLFYYRWREKFLEGGKRALTNGVSGQKAYKAEIEKLQKIIGKEAIKIEISKNRRGFSRHGRGGASVLGIQGGMGVAGASGGDGGQPEEG